MGIPGRSGKDPYPVVVMFNGGGWLINDKSIMDQASPAKQTSASAPAGCDGAILLPACLRDRCAPMSPLRLYDVSHRSNRRPGRRPAAFQFPKT
jgi:hypothetical protein